MKKQFNLKYAGTGIRFPREEDAPQNTPAGWLMALAFVVAVGAGAFLFLPETQKTPQPLPVLPVAAPLPAELPTVAVEAVEPPAVNAGAAAPAEPPVAAVAPAPAVEEAQKTVGARHIVRFGIFVSRENAESLVETLGTKGVSASVAEGMHMVPAFMLKAGPVADGGTLKKAAARLEKFTVALSGVDEQKYLLAGPIWKKDDALAAQKTVRAMGLAAELDTVRKERLVFKAVSDPFDTEEAAKAQAGEWRKKGIEGVIEK